MAIDSPAATKADRLFQQRVVTEIDKFIHEVISGPHWIYSISHFTYKNTALLKPYPVIEIISRSLDKNHWPFLRMKNQRYPGVILTAMRRTITDIYLDLLNFMNLIFSPVLSFCYWLFKFTKVSFRQLQRPYY